MNAFNIFADHTPHRERAIVSVLVLLITAFYLFTMRSGNTWSGDSSMYIAHARNIVEGRVYSDTGYIFNPYHSHAPQLYPPVFPFLLTLPYLTFGLDIEAMKRFMLLPFAGFLVAFYVWNRRRTSPQEAIWLLLLTGMHPLLWGFKEQILSDIPFIAFLFLTFFLVDELEEEQDNSTKKLLLSITVGGGIYLCSGTRTVGILLIPALLISDVLRHRRLRSSSLIACGFASSLILLENMVFNTIGLYDDVMTFERFLHKSPLDLTRNAVHEIGFFPTSLSGLWRGDPLLVNKAGKGILFLGIVGGGGVLLLKRQITVCDVFGVLYISLILVLKLSHRRYLIPLVPLFFVSIVRALQVFPLLRNHRSFQLLLFTSLSVLTILPTILCATSEVCAPFRRSSLKDGIHATSTSELFEYVRKEIPQGAVCVFFRPRVLALFTGHPAANYHKRGDLRLMLEFFRKINARYLIVRHPAVERSTLPRFIAVYKAQLRQIFKNEGFIVYAFYPDLLVD